MDLILNVIILTSLFQRKIKLVLYPKRDQNVYIFIYGEERSIVWLQSWRENESWRLNSKWLICQSATPFWGSVFSMDVKSTREFLNWFKHLTSHQKLLGCRLDLEGDVMVVLVCGFHSHATFSFLPSGLRRVWQIHCQARSQGCDHRTEYFL